MYAKSCVAIFFVWTVQIGDRIGRRCRRKEL